MSRYTGPRLRKVRAFGSDLPGLTRKRPSQKKQSRPGQHGASRMRGKSSTYKDQLVEKQKIRFNYGLNERQLRRYYDRATRMRGNTGDNLLTMIESRLDNMVFRAGFAASIRGARQLINHGHVRVNDHKVDIPSCLISADDMVEIKQSKRELPCVIESIERANTSPRPAFLEIDDANRKFKVLALPARDQILLDVNEIAVIEFYSH